MSLTTVAMLHINECGFQPMTNPDGESLAQRGQKIDERTWTIEKGWLPPRAREKGRRMQAAGSEKFTTT